MEDLDINAFEDSKWDDELESLLLDRPVTSLRDIQYLYGSLYLLATSGVGNERYYTPDDADKVVEDGSDDNLISIKVDVQGDEPTFEGVSIQQFRPELTSKLGYSRKDTSRGAEFSLTFRTAGGKFPEEIAGYVDSPFLAWSEEDHVQKVATEHSDGHLIQSLDTLNQDTETVSEIKDEISGRLEGKRRAFLTVKLRRDEDEGWLWPGEIDVFNKAMRARLNAGMRSKNQTDMSEGIGVDMVTGESDQVLVGLMDDPLRYFLSRQLEKFPNLDGEEAWRNHAVSENTAFVIQNSTSLLDACGHSMFGVKLYTIPYFSEPTTPEMAKELYRLLVDAKTNDETTVFERALELPDDYGLRFYVTVVDKVQSKRNNVVSDARSVTEYLPKELGDARNTVLRSDSGYFRKKDQTDGVSVQKESSDSSDENEYWDTLNPSKNFASVFFGGSFLHETLPQVDLSVGDPRSRMLTKIFGGEAVSVDELLKGYVERICDDGGESFPSMTVMAQYVQLSTLAATDLLTFADDTYKPLTTAPHYMTTDSNTANDGEQAENDQTSTEARKEAFQAFLDDHAALSESPERRAVFSLGALIGHLSRYQDVSQTMADKYPVSNVTMMSLPRITAKTIDKTQVYSSQNQYDGVMFQEVLTELSDTMSHEKINDWELSLPDIKFHYSLGLAYGLGYRQGN